MEEVDGSNLTFLAALSVRYPTFASGAGRSARPPRRMRESLLPSALTRRVIGRSLARPKTPPVALQMSKCNVRGDAICRKILNETSCKRSVVQRLRYRRSEHASREGLHPRCRLLNPSGTGDILCFLTDKTTGLQRLLTRAARCEVTLPN